MEDREIKVGQRYRAWRRLGVDYFEFDVIGYEGGIFGLWLCRAVSTGNKFQLPAEMIFPLTDEPLSLHPDRTAPRRNKFDWDCWYP